MVLISPKLLKKFDNNVHLIKGNSNKVLNKIDNKVTKEDYLIIEDSDGKQKDLFNFVNNAKNKYLTDQHYLDLFGRNGTSATNSIFKIG